MFKRQAVRRSRAVIAKLEAMKLKEAAKLVRNSVEDTFTFYDSPLTTAS